MGNSSINGPCSSAYISLPLGIFYYLDEEGQLKAFHEANANTTVAIIVRDQTYLAVIQKQIPNISKIKKKFGTRKYPRYLLSIPNIPNIQYICLCPKRGTMILTYFDTVSSNMI